MNRVVLDLRDAARAHRIPVRCLPHLVQSARATWTGRMVQEHGSGHVFESLAGQLEEAGFPSSDVTECRGFAAEERHHGVLCGAVVESLGGAAWAEVDAPLPLARHEEVDRLEAVLRNLLSVSCLSETIAVSLIAAERVEMPAGPLRELLTSIWSDEVGHARFGWRIVRERVASLADDGRGRLSAYLAVAFAHVERHELSHLPMRAFPAEGLAVGLCNGAEARSLFYDTVDTAIVPGLEALGLAAERAWSEARRASASGRAVSRASSQAVCSQAGMS